MAQARLNHAFIALKQSRSAEVHLLVTNCCCPGHEQRIEFCGTGFAFWSSSYKGWQRRHSVYESYRRHIDNILCYGSVTS